MRGKIRPRLLLMTNRKSHTRFRLMPKSTLDGLQGPLRTLSQNMRLSEPTTKIWMKVNPHFQWRRCSAVTLVSGNIRFMRTFSGVPWKGVSNDSGLSGVLENMNFQGCRMLRLQHLSKWGQHYYIGLVLFPCHLFHWFQNSWPWMTLKRLNGHYYELPLSNYLLLIYCRVCLHVTIGEVRDPQNICYCEKTADLS